MSEYGLVEIDAAEPFEPLRLTEQVEAGRCAAEKGGIERASSEVVDRTETALDQPFFGGVLERCSDWFRYEERRFDPGLDGRLAEEIELERAVAGGMGDCNEGWWPALLLTDAVDHCPQQEGGERLGAKGGSANDEWSRVPQTAFELSGQARRFGVRAALRGLAGEQFAIGAEEDRRRDRGQTRAQLDDLNLPLAGDRDR